jgi:SAM-dependent methyltransferase
MTSVPVGSPTDTQGTPYLDWERVDELPEPDRIATYLRRAARAGMNVEDKRASLDRLGLRPGSAYLDLGCGVGGDVVAAAGVVGEDGVAVGIDRSRTLVAAADRSDPRAMYVVGDVHALPFSDATFDGVHAERTLQHVSRPIEVVAEVARVLRSGGRVVLSEPDYELDFWDHPMTELTRRIHQAQCRRIRNATIGRHLPRQLALAGLVDVAVEVLPFWWFVTEVGVFADTIRAAVHDGAISQDEADAWEQRLVEVSTEAPVLTGCVRFRATGTKP